MSEKSRYPPSARTQTGPSTQANPFAITSILAAGSTRASRRGSRRSMWPIVGRLEAGLAAWVGVMARARIAVLTAPLATNRGIGRIRHLLSGEEIIARGAPGGRPR